MKEVEYKVVSHGMGWRDKAEDAAWFNQYGKDGWILASVGHQAGMWIFWRYKPSEADFAALGRK